MYIREKTLCIKLFIIQTLVRQTSEEKVYKFLAFQLFIATEQNELSIFCIIYFTMTLKKKKFHVDSACE